MSEIKMQAMNAKLNDDVLSVTRPPSMDSPHWRAKKPTETGQYWRLPFNGEGPPTIERFDYFSLALLSLSYCDDLFAGPIPDSPLGEEA